jgi:hypothetical protein
MERDNSSGVPLIDLQKKITIFTIVVGIITAVGGALTAILGVLALLGKTNVIHVIILLPFICFLNAITAWINIVIMRKNKKDNKQEIV